jgi:pimeloyl-ACP methyl ester carboxylesterase
MAAYEATMRLWTVPYESLDVPSRFGTTHLVACGPKDAPPMILLHGFFMSLTVWAHIVAEFSRDYRLYALDMVGQPGRSVPDQPMKTRGEMAEWLTSVLDALGVNQTHLVGWSYGGFAALNYALHRSDRLSKLVLLTPAGTFVPLKVQFYLRGLLSRLPGRFWSDSNMRWFTYGPNLHNEDTKRIFVAMADQLYAGVRHFRLPPSILPFPFSDEEVRGVGTPTLLLIGQQEALYDPVRAIERAKRLMPNIEAELIPEAGHELPASKPKAVNSRVLKFLEE